MNKILLSLVVCVMFCVSSFVFADFVGPSNAEQSTIKAVKKMKDDTNVILVGKIEKSLGDEKYQFSDGTDTVVIEIDQEIWQGLEVTPNDIVEIYGEVDKSWKSFKIDVDKIIKKIKPN